MNLEMTQLRYGSSFEKFLGVEFKKYEKGFCEISFTVQDHHLNIGKSCHGGVIESLLDIALSGAVTCDFIDKAESVVTMQMNVNFLRPAFSGETLSAYGEIIKKGSTIVYVEGAIKNSEGKLVAKASGDWFVKRPK